MVLVIEGASDEEINANAPSVLSTEDLARLAIDKAQHEGLRIKEAITRCRTAPCRTASRCMQPYWRSKTSKAEPIEGSGQAAAPETVGPEAEPAAGPARSDSNASRESNSTFSACFTPGPPA